MKETVNISLTLMGAVKVLYFHLLWEMLTLLFTLTNVNKHSPKWKRQVVDIYQVVKPQGKYPQQATNTEVSEIIEHNGSLTHLFLQQLHFYRLKSHPHSLKVNGKGYLEFG